jgi:hypothetical protein
MKRILFLLLLLASLTYPVQGTAYIDGNLDAEATGGPAGIFTDAVWSSDLTDPTGVMTMSAAWYTLEADSSAYFTVDAGWVRPKATTGQIIAVCYADITIQTLQRKGDDDLSMETYTLPSAIAMTDDDDAAACNVTYYTGGETRLGVTCDGGTPGDVITRPALVGIMHADADGDSVVGILRLRATAQVGQKIIKITYRKTIQRW